MEFMTAEQLAKRWRVSVGTLSNWRVQRKGPPYVRVSGLRGRVLYRTEDVQQHEQQHTIAPAASDSVADVPGQLKLL